MKVFTADEVSCEVTTYEVPDQLCATGPESFTAIGIDVMRRLYTAAKFVHKLGAIEGYLAACYGVDMDDEEYPAHRTITMTVTNTIIMEARYGRNKRYVLAFAAVTDPKNQPEYDLRAEAEVREWVRRLSE